MKNKKNERLGQVNTNRYGSKMTIIRYENNRNVKVEFEDGYRKKCEYKDFRKGIIRNPYDKSVYERGFLGEGPYKTSIGGKQTAEYDVWRGILQRIYDDKSLRKFPTYKGCSICWEWHSFQNFAEWYNNNYYEIPGEKMHIDKDILIKRNKIYSPNTCIFVPERINYLFVKTDHKRGKYPIGVSFDKTNNKFIVQLKNEQCEKIFMGRFSTEKEAFNAYKNRKEKVIKNVANRHKNQIPKKLYNAILNYVVEIDD